MDFEDFDPAKDKIIGVNCISETWLRKKILTVAAPTDVENISWLSLREKAQLGDEVWEFRSSDESWKHFAGQAGVALLRAGEILSYVITKLN